MAMRKLVDVLKEMMKDGLIPEYVYCVSHENEDGDTILESVHALEESAETRIKALMEEHGDNRDDYEVEKRALLQ